MHDRLIDLEGCPVQVEASKAWFTRRVLPLSIEQLRWRPNPQHWSIAECLDHLNLTLGLALPRVDEAIREGRACEVCVACERSEIEALKLVEPPVNVPAVALPALIPAPAVDPDRLVDHFHQTRDQYAIAVRRVFALDIRGILLVEPVAPLIRSLGGTLGYLAAHDRRHMWQSERVRNAPRFPRAVFGDAREAKKDS